MIRLNWLSKIERSLKYGAIFFGGLVALIGFLPTFPAKNFQASAIKTILLTNELATWISIPVFTGAAAVFTFFKTHFGTSQTWGTVTALLEMYRNRIFEKKECFKTDPAHFNRVTLYKFVSWRWAFCLWPQSNWMVPVARTGHTTHNWKIPRFKAPKSNPDLAQGVAGQTFVNNGVMIVHSLPNLNEATTEDEIIDYSRRGFVPPKWVRKRFTSPRFKFFAKWFNARVNKQPVRSLVGIPIDVKGSPWGAIVIDSRHPEPIVAGIKQVSTNEFKMLGQLLSKLLEN